MPSVVAQRSDAELITRALLEAGGQLGFTLRQLGHVVGLSESSMKNCSSGKSSITSGKNQELALGFIRVYRALYAIVGGDQAQMRHWMHTPNRHLKNKPPALLAQNYQGLAELNVYLDAMRGRL